MRGSAHLNGVDDPAIASPHQAEGPLPQLRTRRLVANLRYECGPAGAGRIGLGAVELHTALIELKALFVKVVERPVERATVHTRPEIGDA